MGQAWYNTSRSYKVSKWHDTLIRSGQNDTNYDTKWPKWQFITLFVLVLVNGANPSSIEFKSCVGKVRGCWNQHSTQNRWDILGLKDLRFDSARNKD